MLNRIKFVGVVVVLSQVLSLSLVHAQAAPTGARSASPAPRGAPAVPPTLRQARLTAKAAVQLSRSAVKIDAKVAQAESQLQLAKKGEQALKKRGRRGRSATVDRANLENNLQDLKVQQIRIHNARNDSIRAFMAVRAGNWQAASAHLKAGISARKGVKVPRVRTIIFSALPPAEANRVSAASGMRFGSVAPRP